MTAPFNRSTASDTRPQLTLSPLTILLRQLLGAGLALAATGAIAQTTDGGTLGTVTVTGTVETYGGLQAPYAGGQVAKGGSLGILGTSNVMDTPFSTTNYTADLLENQQSRTLADVLVNDASVRVLTSTNGFGEDFQIRGFTVPSGDVGLNGLFGLSSGSRVPAEILERVEVLKGPSALANGIAPNGSIGGGINIVTKRAGQDPLTRVTTTFTSDSQLGVHLDVGRRFGEQKEWGVRVNALRRTGESSIDHGNQGLTVGGLALDYAGSKLRWSLNAFTQRESIDEVRPQTAFQNTVTSIPDAPSARRNFFPGTDLKLRDTTYLSNIEYDINDNLTAYAGVGHRDGSANQMFVTNGTARYTAAATTGASLNGIDEQGNFYVRNGYYDSYSETTSAIAGIRARFNTAGVGHALTVGMSRMEQEAGNISTQGATGTPSNIYDPSPLLPITADRGSPVKASETILSSIAIADTMSFAGDRLLLTLGVRDQTVEVKNTYKESATTPLAAVVFKPVNNISVYGNYSEGLTRGAVAPTSAANRGEIFPPFKSKQYETGVKVDWGRVTTVASIFQIKRPSTQTDPVTNIFGYGGEQRNRGLELSAYGELTRGLRLMASAAFTQAELTSTPNGTNDGNDAAGVPKRNFSIGADWDTPWIAGLSLNGRIIHTASSYYNATNTLSVPSWTRYDIGARYRTLVSGKPVILRANIENLFDKDYWLMSGTYATVSAPRTVMLSASVDF